MLREFLRPNMTRRPSSDRAFVLCLYALLVLSRRDSDGDQTQKEEARSRLLQTITSRRFKRDLPKISNVALPESLQNTHAPRKKKDDDDDAKDAELSFKEPSSSSLPRAPFASKDFGCVFSFVGKTRLLKREKYRWQILLPTNERQKEGKKKEKKQRTHTRALAPALALALSFSLS